MTLLGALFASDDREIWERVPGPLNVGVSPGGGAMLTFSIRSGRDSSRSDD